DFGGTTEDEIERALLDTGLVEAAYDLANRGRRLLRPFDDDRATGSERGADLADGLRDGEVPRAERRDRPDRLAYCLLQDTRSAGRNYLSVGPATFLREPFQYVGAIGDFGGRFGQG